MPVPAVVKEYIGISLLLCALEYKADISRRQIIVVCSGSTYHALFFVVLLIVENRPVLTYM